MIENGEEVEKWVEKKNSFPPYIRLREWKSLEMKNSFVLLSRSGRMENVVCINLLSCP